MELKSTMTYPDAGERKGSKETRAITTLVIKYTWLEEESSDTETLRTDSMLSMHRPLNNLQQPITKL